MNPWKHFHMIEITSLNWVLLFLSGVGAIYRVPSHLNAPTPSHCGDWRRLINWRVLGSPCWLISWTPADWTHKVGSPSEISKHLVTICIPMLSLLTWRIWDLLDVPVPLIIGWSQLLDLRRASSWLAQIIRSTTLVALNSSVWRMQKPHGNHGFHRHDLVCQHINLGAIWRICLFENFTLKRDGAHLWVAMIVLSVYEHHSQWTSISS